MGSAEAIIASKLETLRAELAEKQRLKQDDLPPPPQGWAYSDGGDGGQRERDAYDERQRQFDEEIASLANQVRLLEDIKGMLDKQQMTTQTHFLAIQDRDERSSRQNVWLTLISSAISLLIGWALSLLGSPAAVLHALGR